MNWSWAVFFAALIVCTILVQISRGAMNAANIRKYGPQSDYRANPSAAFIGSAVAGSIYAGILTALIGFIF